MPNTATTQATAAPALASPVPYLQHTAASYRTGWVRYARALKATGHTVSAYNTTGAMPTAASNGAPGNYTTLVKRAMPAGMAAYRYVVHCHTCNTWAGHATWASAYAATMAHGSTALAPSVAASLGKAGVPAGCTVRAMGAPTPGAQPATAIPAPLALGPGRPA